MPEYSFQCDLCNSKFSVVWKTKEYDTNIKKLRCKQCGSKKIYRDYSDYNLFVKYVPNLSECKTIGQYADLQTKKYGKEKCQKMLENFKTKKQPTKPLPEGMKRIESPEDMITTRKRP